MHEELIRRGRRRLVRAGGAALVVVALALGVAVFPLVWAIGLVVGLLGGRWGTGWGLVVRAALLSGVVGAVAAVVLAWWQWRQAEARAVGPLQAWPRVVQGPMVTTVAYAPPEPAYRRLRAAAEAMAIATGVLPPTVAVIVDRAPNCMAVGRRADSAVIVVTTGLIEGCTPDELEAVLAYQYGRITASEVALDTLVYACTARAFELWAGVFDDVDEASILLAPVAVVALPLWLAGVGLRAMALHASGELGDGLALRACRNPPAMVSALHKLAASGDRVRCVDGVNAHLWLVYPHSRLSRWLYRSHRVLPARLARLEAMVATSRSG